MSSINIAGDTSGSISLTVPSVAGSNTVTIPASSGSVMVSGNMPAFSAVLTNNTQSISANTYTKAQLGYEFFDTNNNFDTTNYRFTPTIAGYYQINAGMDISWATTSPTGYITLLYKNGVVNFQAETRNDAGNPMYGSNTLTTLVYMNGTTDYLELYGYSVGGVGVIINGSYSSYTNINTWMNGYLARTA
jgi:hypothetical protein